MKYADTCECRGQCDKHAGQCPTIFGQKFLFSEYVEEPMAARYGAGKRLCSGCAPTYDPGRKAREKRAEKAFTERSAIGAEYTKSIWPERDTPMSKHDGPVTGSASNRREDLSP